MTERVPLIWRPTPTGRDLTGRITKTRRIAVSVPHLPSAVPGYVWDRREWLRSVCGPGTRVGTGRTPRGAAVLLVARPHFRRVVEATARLYGEVEVWADVTATSACGRLCWEATGAECSCSCFGENHGGLEWTRQWTKVSQEWVVQHQTQRTMYRVDAAMVAAQVPARDGARS